MFSRQGRMKIVVEYVLIENMLINLISLKTTALVTKEKGRLFLLSAFLGGCLTVVMPLFSLNSIGLFLIQIGLVCIYICLSFKFKTLKKFLRLYFCFFIVTFLYGGACYFVERYFGIESTLVILFIIASLFLGVKLLTKKLNQKRNIDDFCFDIKIETQGQTTKWKAFLDSGNLLFDPLTQSPVTLINFKVFSTIFCDVEILDVLTRSKKIKALKLAHYINFNTLNNNDKILVFQVDRLYIGEKTLEKPILGLSLKNFNEAFGSDVILHNSCA